jgi:hypothetical protein
MAARASGLSGNALNLAKSFGVTGLAIGSVGAAATFATKQIIDLGE